MESELVTPQLLVTCRQMQASMHLFVDRLGHLGVGFDTPEVPGQRFSADQLIPIIGRYDAMIAGDDEVTADVLSAGLPRLKAVAKWGIGVDGIDLAAAADLGIAVTNTPGMFDDDVADVALGYLLSLSRGLHAIDRAVRGGEWLKVEGRALQGKTLGIVGLGGTGRALAARAHVIGMTVVGCDPVPASVEMATAAGVEVLPFEQVLTRADIVSLHCPLTPDTRGLLSAEALARMRPGALLINTSRGQVVDEAALIGALRRGHLGGAALDVFEVEPLPTSSPLVDMHNVILGSHNASNSHEAVVRTSHRALDNALLSLGIGEA